MRASRRFSAGGARLRGRRLGFAWQVNAASAAQAWAELLRGVFAVDVLAYPRCGGCMRLLAAIHPPDVTRAILECLELPAHDPPATQPRQAKADPWPDPAWEFDRT